MSQPPGMPPPGGYPPPGAQPVPGAQPPPYRPGPQFKLRKRNTILIVGLVLLAVAALALLAAVVLGGDAGPSAGGDTPLATGTLQPTPVGTAPPPAPAPGGSTPAPTPSPTPAPAPAPSPTGAPALPPGSTVVLGDNVVQIPVPQGWQTRLLESGSQVIMADDAGHNFWAGLFTTDPAKAASELIAENRDTLIGSENYAQLETTDVRTIPPTGSLVSAAVVEYTGLITDNQATFNVGGLLLVAVRQDGSVLAMTPEISPAHNVGTEAFAQEFNDVFGPVISGALASFSGTG